ncbi:MAG TPA: hypothetical protein VMU05_04245 [Dongiaceae bacterium]|nr:hypothetical protein [Dongiaceae bacterium]
MAKRKAYFFGLGFSFIRIWRVRPPNDDCVSLEWIVVPKGAQLVLVQVFDQEVGSSENSLPFGSESVAG